MMTLHAIFKTSTADQAVLKTATGPAPLDNCFVLEAGDLMGLVARHGDGARAIFEDPKLVQALALAHNHLLSTLCEKLDFLPVQIGSLYSSEAAIVDMMDEHRTTYHAGLERLRGCIEIAAQMQQTTSAATTENNAIGGRGGRAYLMARKCKRDQRRDMAAGAAAFSAKAREKLGAISHESRDLGERGLSFLVPRQDLATFVATAASLNDAASGATGETNVSLTGPLPVYSYVEELAQ